MSKSSKPIPLAIPNDLLGLISEVAERTDRSQQDVMRLALRLGVEVLRRLNYDEAAALVTAAMPEIPSKRKR